MYTLVLFILIKTVISVRILDFDVPEQVLEGTSVTMKCEFDLEGEQFHKVKWLKDEEEFFIYGMIENSKITYPVRGVYLDLDHCNATSVRLSTTDAYSQGLYTCEVQSESSTLSYVWVHSYLSVLPISVDDDNNKEEDLDEDSKHFEELASRYRGHHFNSHFISPSIEPLKVFTIDPFETSFTLKQNSTRFKDELEAHLPSVTSPSTPFYHRLFESKSKSKTSLIQSNDVIENSPSVKATVAKISRESYDEWPNTLDDDVETFAVPISSSLSSFNLFNTLINLLIVTHLIILYQTFLSSF